MSDLYSIPRAARQIGVTPPALRSWIDRDLVSQPSTITATGELAYDQEAVEEIQDWYAVQASTHSTRGPGAAERRERAEELLRDRGGKAHG